MGHYLILARSVTYAQRMQKTLARAGVRCQIFRAPRDLTELGCAYAVRVSTTDLVSVLYMLRRDFLDPLKIFEFQHGYYQEVRL